MGVYDDRTAVFVTPFNGSTINYGFLTNIDGGDQSALGQQPASAATGPVVYGSSRPKPARLKRERTTGSTSSFVDWQSYTAALAAGWKKIRGCLYGPAPYDSTRAIRVVAEVTPGVNVSWDMRKTQYNQIVGDLPSLGIDVMTATNGRNAVFKQNSISGASIFGAKTRIGDNSITVGYIDSAAADSLPDGWTAFTSGTTGGDPTQTAP